jgi:hypothetical protein
MAEPPKTHGPNGNGKLTWWLICTVGTICAGAVAGAFGTIKTSAERIAVLESREADTRQRLQRIEEKVDHLLENGRHKR